MASQQDPQARLPTTMEGKITPKRPLESSPSGGSDANKPAMKLQKLDLPPAGVPPPKQEPIGRGITPAHFSAPMSDVRAGGVPQRQLEAGGNAGPLHPTAEKPRAPSAMGKDAPVGVAPEGKKSPAVGEQPRPPAESRKADAEVKAAAPANEPVKSLKPVDEPAKASKPEPAELPKSGDESKGGAKEGTEGGKEDAARKEGGVEEGGEKESLGLAGRRILRPRQASAPPQGQRSRLRHRDGEAG